jgi:hypothetical protein
MNKIDWKRKLTSRKFWVAVAGFVAGLILAFEGSAETAETVSGVIMSGASVIGYLLAEGLADASHSEDNTKETDNK